MTPGPDDVHARSGASGPLHGLRVVECASFVAGPSGCLSLLQQGADVVRVDPIGGAADFHRWPVSSRGGTSLFWTSLNRGKRSVAVNMRSPEGREIVTALASAPGPGGGILVDNAVGRTWLSYAALCERRPDMIQVHIQGHADGRPAVDYTVNPEVGVPTMTGPVGLAEPVNHVLPAWDLLTGMTAVNGLLAALHRREREGVGTFLEVALADVALAGVANMGWLTEADEQGDRPRHGNHVYGSFGVDFATKDGHRVMVIALTTRQWDALRAVTNSERVFAALEEALAVDLSEESDRYRLRETIAAIIRPWFEDRALSKVSEQLDAAQVLWSRYRTMSETVAEFRSSGELPILTDVDQPDIGRVVSARSPLRSGGSYGGSAVAPRLGAHTDEVLTEVLALSEREIASLHDRGIVSSGE